MNKQIHIVYQDPPLIIQWQGKELGFAGPSGFEVKHWSHEDLLELAGQMEDLLSPMRRHALLIAREVAKEFETSLENIFSRSRDQDTADARHVCISLFREHHGSVKDRTIAEMFHRERSLVSYACGQFKALVESDAAFAKKVTRLRTRVRKVLWPEMEKAAS